MTQPVEINFTVGGIQKVLDGFKTVEQAMLRSQSKTAAAEERDRKKREASAKREADKKIAEATRASTNMSRLLQRNEALAERLIDKEQRAREAANLKRERSEERLQAKLEAIKERAARKDAARAAKEVYDQQRLMQRLKERYAYALSGAMIGGAGRGLTRFTGMGMNLMHSVLSLGGGFDIASSVQRGFEAEKIAALTSNAAINPLSSDPRNRVRMPTEGVLGATKPSSLAFAFSQTESQDALRTFVHMTGDLQTGIKLFHDMAEAARGTGTDLNDVAKAVGLISNKLREAGESTDTAMDIFSVLQGEAKAGTLEAIDFTKFLPKVIAPARLFEGGVGENIGKLGAIMQQAGGMTGGAAGAATSITAFASALTKSARLKKFQQLAGFNPFTDKSETTLRDPNEIIRQSIIRTKGDLNKINAIYGSEFAKRAILPFVTAYNKGYTDPTTGKMVKGEAGLNAIFKYAGGEALTKEQRAANARNVMETPEMRFARVMREFDEAVRTQLIPGIIDLLPEIQKLIPVFLEFNKAMLPLIQTVLETVTAWKDELQWLASHPLLVAGGMIGGSVAIEAAKVAAQAAGEFWFLKMAGLLGTTAAGAAAAGGGAAAAGGGAAAIGATTATGIIGRTAAGVLGAAGSLAAVGTSLGVGLAVGASGLAQVFSKEERTGRGMGALYAEQEIGRGETARQNLLQGPTTPENMAKAKAMYNQLKTDIDFSKEDGGVMGAIGGGASALLGQGGDIANAKQREVARHADDLTRQMKLLGDAIAVASKNLKTIEPVNPNRGQNLISPGRAGGH